MMNKKIISVFLTLALFFVSSSITLAEASASANAENGLVNVAVGKDITLTTGSECNGMIKENLNDGNVYTYGEVIWDKINTGVGYIIDLGKTYHIEQFKLYALPNNPSGRNDVWIDISVDGNSWTNILSRNSDVTDEFSMSQMTSDVLTVDAPTDSYIRYVKLTSISYGVWFEFEIYASMPEIVDAQMLYKTISVNFSEEIKEETVSCDNLKLYAGEEQITDYNFSVNKNRVLITLDEVLEDTEYFVAPTSQLMSIYDDAVLEAEKIPAVVQLTVDSFDLNKSSKTATAVTQLINNTENDKTATLFVGYYSPEGILKNTKLCTKTIAANSSADFEAVLTSEKIFEDKSLLRAYIWDMTDGVMAPIDAYKELDGNITEIYVSPSGDDNYDGSIDTPFATIERAMEEVRLHNSDMGDDITVYLREGTYQLDDTLVFDENDSATNGHKILYKSYPGEDAVITGGVKVENWTECDNGIWYADVSGIESALVMSVDGVAARRAQSEEWIDIDTLFPDTREIDTNAGLTVADTKYAQYRNQSDIQLRFMRGWKSYLLNVDSIAVDGESSKFMMRQPTYYFAEYNKFNDGHETHFYNIADNNNFKIENALEELDTEGEFYYSNNENEQRIYYMPRDGENLQSADVRIAKLDTLIEIDGYDNANKVKNITFEDLTFSDGAWSRASEYGFVTDQAQILVYEPEMEAENPGYTLSPANILVNRAENISFKNNVIRNMGAGGIYFYTGVDNSSIVGNAFYDIGDSAIVVSSPDQVYNETAYKGKNLAVGKPVKAGSITGEYYTPERAFDSNTRTLWAPELYGNSWIQVDLEDAYEIDRIELDYRTDGGHKSFDGVIILASNDPNFEISTQLTTTVTSNDAGVIHTVSNTEKYRYIRFKHTSDTGYWVLPEARIINESMEYVSSTDICDNNLINNNFITRVGQVSTAAPGMQLYYVQNTEISNNYIYEVPYSGIALGWGWSTYKDSDTCGDNSIINNRIDKSMLQSFDGAGIYICGQQYGTSVVSGNHITNTINGGGVYLDTYSSNNDIKNNVIENTLESFCAPADSFNNKWSNNYVSSILTTISNVTDNTFEEPVAFIMGDYPDEASEIVQSAGLADEYKYLVQLPGVNNDSLTVDDYYNNMLHDEDNHHILPWYLKKIYNTSFIDSANKWIELATVAGYDAEEISKLQSVVSNILDTEEREVIFEQCDTLRNAMYEFSSNIK